MCRIMYYASFTSKKTVGIGRPMLNFGQPIVKCTPQAAGFLRVIGGDEPLDATEVHPESYEAARALLGRAGVRMPVIWGGRGWGGGAYCRVHVCPC